MQSSQESIDLPSRQIYKMSDRVIEIFEFQHVGVFGASLANLAISSTPIFSSCPYGGTWIVHVSRIVSNVKRVKESEYENIW